MDGDHDESGNGYVTVNEDLTTTLRLAKPVTRSTKGGRDEEVIDTLTFPAEATVRHLEATDKAKGDVAKAVYLMSALVGVPYETLRKMSLADFNRASGVLNSLVGKDLTIGGPSLLT